MHIRTQSKAQESDQQIKFQIKVKEQNNLKPATINYLPPNTTHQTIFTADQTAFAVQAAVTPLSRRAGATVTPLEPPPSLRPCYIAARILPLLSLLLAAPKLFLSLVCLCDYRKQNPHPLPPWNSAAHPREKNPEASFLLNLLIFCVLFIWFFYYYFQFSFCW